jgi:hypothetical protein
MSKPQLKLYLAAPRGFCAGVDRAIKIVELALQKWGAPVYVRHEIVHNKFVVDSLRVSLINAPMIALSFSPPMGSQNPCLMPPKRAIWCSSTPPALW